MHVRFHEFFDKTKKKTFVKPIARADENLLPKLPTYATTYLLCIFFTREYSYYNIHIYL